MMVQAPLIQWEGEVMITAEEALAASRPAKGRGGRKTDHVEEFLCDMLAGGPILATIVNERAEAHGFSPQQLRTAKRKLGIVVFKEKVFQGQWKWALPEHAPGPEERTDEPDQE
jgi:hypothetical protein